VKTHGPRSRELALVLAGTHRHDNGKGRPPANEAVVFNHVGEEILRQRKLHRWNLGAERCEQLGIAEPETDTQRYEYIEPGTEMEVVEFPGLGRFAVLICEDHGRDQPGRWLRENLLFDLQLVPIMDTHLDPKRWAVKHAKSASKIGHTRVIVANSLALTLRQNHRINEKGDEESKKHLQPTCGIACCTDIEDGKPLARIVQVSVSRPRRTVTIDWNLQGWDDLP
jgi:predicted amidohydrolase